MMTLSKDLEYVSFFDFDKTLYKGQRGYVIFDFPHFLEPYGLFSTEALDKLEDLLISYRNHEIDRTTFALDVIKYYYLGIKGKTVVEIEDAASEFWAIQSHKAWYSYSIDLVNLMNQHTTTILVTGSPIEPLRYIQEFFNFHEIHATTGLINEQGVFTGQFLSKDERATSQAKKIFLNKFEKRFAYASYRSFAFGDAESDIPLLEAIDPKNSFVLGEGEELLELIKKNGWQHLKHEETVMSSVQDRVDILFNVAN